MRADANPWFVELLRKRKRRLPIASRAALFRRPCLWCRQVIEVDGGGEPSAPLEQQSAAPTPTKGCSKLEGDERSDFARWARAVSHVTLGRTLVSLVSPPVAGAQAVKRKRKPPLRAATPRPKPSKAPSSRSGRVSQGTGFDSPSALPGEVRAPVAVKVAAPVAVAANARQRLQSRRRQGGSSRRE